jgi:chitin-binding protein
VTAPAAEPEPDTGDSWETTATYVAGNRAVYQGIEYEAKWWTQGDIPGASAVWQRITPVYGPLEWNPGAVFVGGDEVIYQGVVYRAKWWTQGDVPATSQVWQVIG